MSLIHWWPLTANLSDKAINYTVGGTYQQKAPSPIGGCLHSTAGYQTNIKLVDEWSHWQHNVSMSCWVKVNFNECNTYFKSLAYTSSATNPTGCLIGQTSYGGLGIYWRSGNNIYNGGTTADLTTINFRGYTRGSSSTASTSAYTVEYDKWYHMTLVADYNAKVLRFYVNGTQIGNDTSYASIPEMTDNRYFGWGRAEVYGGNGPGARLPMDICDVRIYDHVLSKQEVKELSQGLMFHYSFNDIYAEEITNLVTPGVNTWGKLTINVTGKHTGDGHYTVTTTTANSGTRGQIRLYFPLSILTIGTSYYFSCKYKVVSGTGNLALVDWCDSSLTQKTSTNCGSYMILTAYCSTTRDYNSTYRFLDMNIDANSVVEIWDIQLQTNKVTPYTIGTRPGMLANEAGYEEPMSVQNLILSSDTNCGTYCGIFDSTKPTQIRMNPKLEGATDVTVACWLYPQSGSTAFTDNALYSVIAGTGINLYAYGRSNAWLSCANCLTLNTWNHVVTTYSATERILYVNGKKVGSDTVSGVFDARASLDVGYGSTTTRALNGRISDFRVYGTTLTEDDVKILYESRASVDKEQDIFSNEFIENFNENMVTTDSWEQGGIQDADGKDANNMATRLRTKYLPVLSGLSYTYKAATGINIRYIHYYDADNKWISAHGIMANSTTQTTPDNAAYVRWVLQYTSASLEIPVANIADYGAVMMPSLIYEVADIVDSSETVVNKTYNINTNDICENHKAGIYKKGTMTGRNFNEI